MKLNNSIIAYELAHNKYMEWISETQSQSRDYVTAYETIEELLNIHGLSSHTHTGICGHEYKIYVFIEDERFEFTFTY